MLRNTKKYDAILNDAFSGSSPAKTLTTVEAVRKIKESLNVNGVYLTNVISALEGENSKFLRAEVNTIKQVFKNVYIVPSKKEYVANETDNSFKSQPVVLTIMDGYGLNPSNENNAIYSAKTPNLDKIFAENPRTDIGASGMDVGLPDGQMGNSEVGHTNIGAGRVVFQDLPRISCAIDDGSFFENRELESKKPIFNALSTSLSLLGFFSVNLKERVLTLSFPLTVRHSTISQIEPL